MSASRTALPALLAGLALALSAAPARAQMECGGEYDTCECGRDTICCCCTPGGDCGGTCGNCVWHAWHSACCNWGRALEWCTDAQYWNDRAVGYGYSTGMAPANTAVFVCEPSTTCSGWGHVGYVVTANADGSFSSTEQFCAGACGTHSRTRASGFATGGFIYNPGGVVPPPPTCTGTDGATFVSETIPDGTHFAAGASFTKTWTLRNSGSSTWTRDCHHLLAFDGEQQFGAAAQTELPDGTSVSPGSNYTWSVAMTAPSTAGTYRGYWKMDRYGTARFGERVWVEIVVDGSTPPTDGDGDGYPAGTDCNDGNAGIHPGAAEVCNGVDEDCDGDTDEGVRNLCGTCGPEPPETCDGVDNNCNGTVDEGCSAADADADADADTFDGIGYDIPRTDTLLDGTPSEVSADAGPDGWTYIYVEDGCGCAVPGRRASGAASLLALRGAAALFLRRKR